MLLRTHQKCGQMPPYRELRQTMQGVSEPCISVRQMRGALIAYNLVRRKMALVALEAMVPASDVGFTQAPGYLRHEASGLGNSLPEHCPDM